MKLPINWLKEFINIPFSTVVLAEELSQLGIEVERIDESKSLVGVKVGKVLSVKKHPTADKLTVCSVDVGEQSAKQIICGAGNVKKGIKVPVVLPGAVLPNGMKIEKRKIRGIESCGMICSEEELGLADNSEGIWILPDKVRKGEELSDELNLNEPVLDITLTPNRGDCLSILGISRELSALTSKKLKVPPHSFHETNNKIKDKLDVEVENSSLCPRYTAKMIAGIQLRESPPWMRKRLLLCGVRPINNIVDITNYVMLETGQPLHAFDYEKLTGRKIIVRLAKPKEKILCLDEIERRLSGQNLVIADGKRPVAVAGVIGGEEASVSVGTKNIVLESANFSASSVRKTSRDLNLSTESSYRFERDTNPADTAFAAQRACYLIEKLANGKVLSGTIDVKKKTYPRSISFNPAQIERILGVEIPSYEKLLKGLGFKVKKQSGKVLKVSVPSWRSDVKQEIDLIEEVARMNNYDRIPVTLPSGEMPPLIQDRKERIINKLRDVLNRLSLNEVVNFSLIGKSLIKKSLLKVNPEKAIKIDNAISEDFEFLRFSLIPSLLQVANENVSRGEKNVRIFELRRIYRYDRNKSPKESLRLGILLTGDWQEHSWVHSGQRTSFYVLNGILETLTDELSLELAYNHERHPFFSDACSFSFFKYNTKVGVIGEVDSNVIENFSLKEKTYVAEIDIEKLLTFIKLERKIKPIAKYPAVARDVSFIVPDEISSGQIEKIMFKEGAPLIRTVKMFDYYKGKQVQSGFVGMTYSMYFRSTQKTLTDKEVTEKQDKIIKKLQEKLGLELRS